MGNQQSEQSNPKIFRSVSEELWAKAFNHVNERSQEILASANEQSQSGRDLDDVRVWCHKEIGQLTLLCPEVLELLWKKYDANKDGSLEKAELKRLIHDYLEHARKEIPDELVRVLKDHLRSTGMSESDIRAYLQNPDVSDALDTARDDLTVMINVWLRDIDRVAARVHEKLDYNRDGSVSKTEFFIEFPSVCDEVCNLTQYKRTLFRLSCLGAEEHSQIYSELRGQ